MLVDLSLCWCVVDLSRLSNVGIVGAFSFELVVKIQHQVVFIPDDAEVTVGSVGSMRTYSQL